MEYFYISTKPTNLDDLLTGSRATTQPTGDVYWAHGSDVCLVNHSTDKPFRLPDSFTATAAADRYFDLSSSSSSGSRFFLLASGVVLCRDQAGLYQIASQILSGTNYFPSLIRNGIPIISMILMHSNTYSNIYQYNIGKPDTCCITYPKDTANSSFSLFKEGALVSNASISNPANYYKSDGSPTIGTIGLVDGVLKFIGDGRYIQFTKSGPPFDIISQDFAFAPSGATLVQDSTTGLYFYSYLSSANLNLETSSGPFYDENGVLYSGVVASGKNQYVVYKGIAYPMPSTSDKYSLYVNASSKPIGFFKPSGEGLVDPYGAIYNSRNYGTPFAITKGAAVFSHPSGASQAAVPVQLGKLSTYADAPLPSASYVAAPNGFYGSALVLNYSYYSHALIWLVVIIFAILAVLVAGAIGIRYFDLAKNRSSLA